MSGEGCPFCLEPLGPNSLALGCGHAFHSICAVQFLLQCKRCPTCQAPVDENRLVDISQLPPEAAGRHFLPPSPPGQQQEGPSGGKGGGTPGLIQLHAFAGSAAPPAASAAAAAPVSRRQSQASDDEPAPPPWLPVYLAPSPRSQQALPGPFVGVLVEGAPLAEEPPPAGPPPPPLRTIVVVRPNRVRRRLVVAVLIVAMALIAAVPIILSTRSSSDGRPPTEKECWSCFLIADDPLAQCPGCEALWDDWWEERGRGWRDRP